MSRTPARASISASASVAHLCLAMPRSNSNRTISAILCVLQCGRNRSGRPAIRTIVSRFCSSNSRNTIIAGVKIWLVSLI